MAATQRPSGKDMPSEPALDGQPPSMPDEDGPHDVSDDQVIEKTLPTARTSGDDANGDRSREKP